MSSLNDTKILLSCPFSDTAAYGAILLAVQWILKISFHELELFKVNLLFGTYDSNNQKRVNNPFVSEILHG